MKQPHEPQRSSLDVVDHLVYAAPDLDPAVDGLARLLGVRAAPGGEHPGQGTRNALLGLGPTSYLEIVGPDPHQPRPPRPRWFGVDALEAPRLVAWAARESDLAGRVAAARRAGIGLGEILAGRRRRADGVPLAWRFTDPRAILAGGLVPFFIDWGATPHPARTAPGGVELIALRAEHPAPAAARAMLRALGIHLAVERAVTPALVAEPETPRGRVELR
jgi:hypothetical protein